MAMKIINSTIGDMNSLPSYCGFAVYSIKNLSSGKEYIGQTCNAKKRIGAHMSTLKNGKHTVKDMQADYNQGDIFVWRILNQYNSDKSISRDIVREQEYRYLHQKRGRLYNKEQNPPLIRINGTVISAADISHKEFVCRI